MGQNRPGPAALIYQKVLKEIEQDDLFKAHKKSSIQEALKLYPLLKELVEQASDDLDAAIRISALGNILDAAGRGWLAAFAGGSR